MTAPLTPESAAERMAMWPGRETVWAIENIRTIAESSAYDDAQARALILTVVAGLDLAEQRRAER